MVSTRRKQQNTRPFSQLDDFEQDVFFGDAANSGQPNGYSQRRSIDRKFLKEGDQVSVNRFSLGYGIMTIYSRNSAQEPSTETGNIR